MTALLNGTASTLEDGVGKKNVVLNSFRQNLGYIVEVT